MKSVICWTAAWMLYWIILAAGTPSFFPSWVQSFIYGFGLASAIFGAAYAYHVVLLKDDIKRLETKNTDLEKQIQKEPAALPQTAPEPVNVVEVSEVHQETPKLLPAEASTNKESQAELKIQALKTANTLYGAIKEAKRQTGGAEINVELLYEARLNDFRYAKYNRIVDSILHYYSEDIHDSAVELKTKILAPEGTKLLAVGDYTNPQGVRDLEAIAQDLKNIGASPFTQP